MLKPEVITQLNTLSSFAEIKEAWDYLKHRNDIIQRQAVERFYPGQNVQWDGKHGHQEGVIQSVNIKTATVKASTGAVWRVSPSMLRVA